MIVDAWLNLLDYLRPHPYVVPRGLSVEIMKHRRRLVERVVWAEWNSATSSHIRAVRDNLIRHGAMRTADAESLPELILQTSV